MIDLETELERWLRETAATRNEPFRVALLIDGERAKRQQLRTLVSDDSKSGRFELETRVNRESRYRYVSASDQDRDRGHLRESAQFRIPVRRNDSHGTEDALVIETTVNRSGRPEIPEAAIDAITATCLIGAQKGSLPGIESLVPNRVAGLEAEQATLESFLTQSLSDWGLRDPGGMLLCGPPGTGKTELVKTVCEGLYGAIPETISGPEVLSRWVGESEATLRRTFDRARSSAVPVLYIDEIDAIGSARADSTQDYTQQLVSQLLVLLDGIETKRKKNENSAPFKVVASTNTAGQLDPALTRPGRLGDYRVEFERPTETQRRAILHHYLERINWTAGALRSGPERFVAEAPSAVPNSILEHTEGYTGADIEYVVLVAARRAMDREQDLDWSHLDVALELTDDDLPTEAADDS